MTKNRLIELLGGRGIIPASELRDALGISPATLSRWVGEAGDAVVRMGRGRATVYSRARRVDGLPWSLPVFRVDRRGKATRASRLVPLERGATWVDSAAAHLRAGLPPFVADMAPAGFLGRRFADWHADLALPQRLQDWNDDHRLRAVALRGDDCPGDLIVGQTSLQRFLDSAVVQVEERDYPRLAESSGLGGAGSSAAGEQPKFTAFSSGRQVLVKFTPGDGSPSDERWRDLLVCEALALETLTAHGIPAAHARIADVGTRRFLEVERFDRVGARGRVGVMSLGPIDDGLHGQRDSWTLAAQRLLGDRMLSEPDARTIAVLDAFGRLIANGDRHFGNLCFFADGLAARPDLALAPVYDMVPMDLAPSAGVVPPARRPNVTPRAELIEVWAEAEVLAERFWTAVGSDRRISAAFRAGIQAG